MPENLRNSTAMRDATNRSLASVARSLKRDARENALALSLMERLETSELERAAGARVEARLEQRVAELDSLLELVMSMGWTRASLIAQDLANALVC